MASVEKKPRVSESEVSEKGPSKAPPPAQFAIRPDGSLWWKNNGEWVRVTPAKGESSHSGKRGIKRGRDEERKEPAKFVIPKSINTPDELRDVLLDPSKYGIHELTVSGVVSSKDDVLVALSSLFKFGEKKLGEGAYGTVYDGTHDDIHYAVKLNGDEFFEPDWREVRDYMAAVERRETPTQASSAAHSRFTITKNMINEMLYHRYLGGLGVGPCMHPTLGAILVKGTRGSALWSVLAMEKMRGDLGYYIYKLQRNDRIKKSTRDDKLANIEASVQRLVDEMFEHGILCTDFKAGNILADWDSHSNINKMVLSDFGGDFCCDSDKCNGINFSEMYVDAQKDLLYMSLAMCEVGDVDEKAQYTNAPIMERAMRALEHDVDGRRSAVVKMLSDVCKKNPLPGQECNDTKLFPAVYYVNQALRRCEGASIPDNYTDWCNAAIELWKRKCKLT